MDPTMPVRPRHWRKIKGVCLGLLVVAAAMAGGGWAGSHWGLDPGVSYRLAALLAAGAFVSGVMWFVWAGMDDAAD